MFYQHTREHFPVSFLKWSQFTEMLKLEKAQQQHHLRRATVDSSYEVKQVRIPTKKTSTETYLIETRDFFAQNPRHKGKMIEDVQKTNYMYQNLQRSEDVDFRFQLDEIVLQLQTQLNISKTEQRYAKTVLL